MGCLLRDRDAPDRRGAGVSRGVAMSKHTPGPWGWYSNRALEAKNETVLVGDCGLPSCGRTRLFVSDADARLIAAAPDLLAALKALLAEAESMGYALDQEFRVASDGNRSEPTFDAAKAAITKAEGEEKDRSLKP